MSLANHIAAGAFGGEGEVIALAVAPGDAEAVKGDNVARRVGGNGAQHHHRHALALQIVDRRRLLYRVADVLDQQAFIQPFQRLREQRQQTRAVAFVLRGNHQTNVAGCLTGEVLRGKARAIVEFFNGPQHSFPALFAHAPGAGQHAGNRRS